jgi:flagellar assembly protein FliH
VVYGPARGRRRARERAGRGGKRRGRGRMSKVIKAEQARRDGLRLGAFHLRDIQAEAEAIVARAREEARSILVAAQERAGVVADRARQEGWREGHEKGLAEGVAAGREQGLAEAREEFRHRQEGLLSALTGLMKELEGQKGRLFSQAHRDLVRLAVAIAGKVVKREVDQEAGVAEANVREAVALTGAASDVTVRVHPGDLESLSLLAGEVVDEVGRLKHLRLVADETVGRGGCVVSTESGQVDGRLEKQLSRIAEQLLPGGDESKGG